MAKKRIVMALGHHALGTSLPEQKESVKHTRKGDRRFLSGGMAGSHCT